MTIIETIDLTRPEPVRTLPRLHPSVSNTPEWGVRFCHAMGPDLTHMTGQDIVAALHKRDWGYSPETVAAMTLRKVEAR